LVILVLILGDGPFGRGTSISGHHFGVLVLHVTFEVVAVKVGSRTYAAEKLSFVLAREPQMSVHRLLGFVGFAATRAGKWPRLVALIHQYPP